MLTGWLTLVLAAPAADAVSVVRPPALGEVRPRDGERGVPTNTLIWLHVGDARGVVDGTRATLLDADGDEVETIGRPARQDIYVLEPVDDLAPDRTYVVDVGSGDPFDHVRFQTADGPTEGAPEPPQVAKVRTYARPGRIAGAGWDVGGTVELRAPDAAWVACAEDGASPLDVFRDDETPPYRFSAVGDREDVVARLGHPCGGTPSHGTAETIQFAAMNLAGEASAWSEPRTVVYCGCQSSGPTGALGALALLGLGSFRRRGRP